MFFFLPTVALPSLLASLWRNETGIHSPIGQELRVCLSPTRLKMLLLLLQLLMLRRTLRMRTLMASLMVRMLALKEMEKTMKTMRRRNLSDLGMSSMLFSLFGILMPKGER